MAIGGSFPEVLRAAQLGAEWAWRAIYRDLSPAILGYLRLQGVLEPEDFAGEVFVQVVRHIGSFEGSEDQFRSWVFVIAHHRAQDYRRSRTRKPVEPADLATITRVAPSGNAEDEAVARLGAAGVERVLSELTDEQRDVMLLRIVAGLTVEETAAVLDRRVSAVKALQRRAVATIRRKGLVARPGAAAQAAALI
jgi:RNA polymerase sigma-70 factor (ECF subfamily)